MQITFRRLTDRRHQVEVVRGDGSRDVVELDTKDLLRHDLAHLAFEVEAGLEDGVWGSVARGGRLDGTDIDGADVAVAERAAGPLQTLMRTGASAEEVLAMLEQRVPALATRDLAERVHERARRLTGHWNATRHGQDMAVEWPFA